MYAPPQFKPDRSACLAFAAARGFGLACAHDAAGPIASPLPFAIQYASDGTPLLSFHVARNNPLARCADARTPWLMAVTAGHAYVSADWYASPDQVPTWLYRSVQLTGPAAVMSASRWTRSSTTSAPCSKARWRRSGRGPWPRWRPAGAMR